MSEGDAALPRLTAALRRLTEQTCGRARSGRSHEDADDTVGSVDTDDALGFDPFPLLRALHEHGARVTLIGQIAGILHGSSELTGDLDLLWDGAPDGAPALAAAFASVSAQLTDDDGAPVRCDPVAFSLPKLVFRTGTASGDCCTPALPWGGLAVTDFLTRSVLAHGPDGLVVRYLRREDLVAMRRAVGRPKDLRRADELERLASMAGQPPPR